MRTTVDCMTNRRVGRYDSPYMLFTSKMGVHRLTSVPQTVENWNLMWRLSDLRLPVKTCKGV